jgi:hypothetical protein
VSADLSLIAAGGKAAVEEAKVRNARLKEKYFVNLFCQSLRKNN